MRFKLALLGVLLTLPVTMITWADPVVQPIEQSEGMLMRSN